jgi:hypothetical protein
LGTGKDSLLSVVVLALGKEASFNECLLEYSTKELTKGSAGDPFVECHLIRSAKTLVKGPTRGFFDKCLYSGHSAQTPSPLPIAVTTTFLCRVLDKKYSTKNPLPIYSSPSFLCRMLHSAKHLPSVLDTRQTS